MSTRSNIIIKDNSCKVYLYRHSDGYPEGAGVDLKKFLEKHEYDEWSGSQLATDLIRFNKILKYSNTVYYPYELTNGIHGDIEYLYVITLTDTDSELKCYNVVDCDANEEDIIKPENEVEIKGEN